MFSKQEFTRGFERNCLWRAFISFQGVYLFVFRFLSCKVYELLGNGSPLHGKPQSSFATTFWYHELCLHWNIRKWWRAVGNDVRNWIFSSPKPQPEIQLHNFFFLYWCFRQEMIACLIIYLSLPAACFCLTSRSVVSYIADFSLLIEQASRVLFVFCRYLEPVIRKYLVVFSWLLE